MKVFIKSSDVNSKTPKVLAVYPSGSDVPDDAHGAQAKVFEVPASVIVRGAPKIEGMPAPMPTLANKWRDSAAEARKHDHAYGVHEVLRFLLKHGLDTSKWPEDAKKRLADIDKKWPPA